MPENKGIETNKSQRDDINMQNDNVIIYLGTRNIELINYISSGDNVLWGAFCFLLHLIHLHDKTEHLSSWQYLFLNKDNSHTHTHMYKLQW